ncbi:MAG: cell division protein FtsA [Candidatus Levybacteria bacterium]|nr:cell division protein FtsA [Candidatus Levybacteria bacterium]MDZ4227715.1 cell division protein FtsA [Candidatus Levybacteria bacterium]
MLDGKIVVGVDIGTSKIVTIIARVDEEFVNVLGVSEVVSRGIKKGQIVDIKQAVDSINNSLDGAERMAGYSVSHVVASIGGSHIESQNSRGVVAVSSSQGEVAENDLSRVIDAAKAVSLPSSRQIIHVLPRNYIVDGQEGIKDPIGMKGIRLEVDTHLVSAASTSLSNLEKAFSQVGIDIDGVVFSGYASGLAVLSETEKELGVILVDIGSGTTDISIYIDGSVAYSSVLPIGARHITNDLAIGLRISLESAEKIKLYLSAASKKPKVERLGETFDRETSRNSDELDLSSLNLPEDLKKVSNKTLVDGIIRPRLNELFTMIGIEVKRSGYAGQIPSGIVITGGGALTVGLTDSAKRTLAMPVRIGIPTNMKGLIDEIESPSFATVVGLSVFGASLDIKQSMPFGISIPNLGNLGINKLITKAINFVKSFMP